MKLYVIYDEDSDLYVSHSNPKRLVEFGANVQFYNTRSDVMRVIDSKLCEDYGFKTTNLQNDLAWDLLEKVHGKDRWHINCTRNEYEDAVSQFKNLKVQCYNIGKIDG